ncbi:uncharacterized protein LOC126899921 [Daktulosphaira vitifoliae]|uniref:uncharacterized protein LOC126899921 n=1 Tax=Daktulosphaira vitifoliae TaxID=58002 RepID=UPI0021AA765C|nr:uncharacterized protein LOC126899921 [Daktulosphaira vitifoliae]XP_050531155.1 uncharacterized protein LOC126899921 [Daktulosphaira vitifoliae]XP_050531156.1 uncharacterized protein LOC126899921 [Daktulosphaira vitifoliae]
MASWLFGISKLKTENVETCETQRNHSSVTAPEINPQIQNSTTWPNILPYDLKSTNSPTDFKANDLTSESIKIYNMLDNIPFIMPKEINACSSSLNYNLESIRNCLISVKEFLESDANNYDFSNDRHLHSNMPENAINCYESPSSNQLKNNIRWMPSNFPITFLRGKEN